MGFWLKELRDDLRVEGRALGAPSSRHEHFAPLRILEKKMETIII